MKTKRNLLTPVGGGKIEISDKLHNAYDRRRHSLEGNESNESSVQEVR